MLNKPRSHALQPARTFTGLALMLCLLPACQGPGSAPGGSEPAAGTAAEEAITSEFLRDAVAALADDAMAGRGPASAGDVATRMYLQQEMQKLGIQPGGPDGRWEQPVEMVSIESSTPDVWSFSAGESKLALAQWDEYIASSGVQAPVSTIENAELVFVGYGIQAPEYDWDDFKGQDLSGKVLVILNNDPDWDDDLFKGNRRLYYGRWDYKYESAAKQGAAGAIIIHTTPSAGYPWQVVQTSWTGPQFELPAGDEPRIQVTAWVTEEAARKLMQLGGHDLDALREAAKQRDFKPLALGIKTHLEFKNRIESVASANVAGLLPGRDPDLAKEVVVITAHHDHLGVGEPNAAGDTIYNGALDNASGSAQVLALARAFKAMAEPPRRSILFLFVAGEEQGLLGSEYYSLHPTFAPGRIAANVNLDGGNIWGPTRDITYIGHGKSSLDAIVEAVAAEQGRIVKGDQFPDKGSFYRSDQFNFARIGVPAFYPSVGTDFVGKPEGWGKETMEAWIGTHYHQPSDELTEDWNFEGMIQDSVLVFRVAQRIAEADELPSWNPGDEFEAARLEALEGLGR